MHACMIAYINVQTYVVSYVGKFGCMPPFARSNKASFTKKHDVFGFLSIH